MAAEKQYENKIKKFLKDNGAWMIKYWAGSEYTKSGIPDILACVNGYFVGIEVKAPNGRASELQLYNLREIEKAGGYGILLYPKQWDDFKAFINAIVTANYDVKREPIVAAFYERVKGW